MSNHVFFLHITEHVFHFTRSKGELATTGHSLNMIQNGLMIIVRFGAGLGNQMLQYATYLSMKKRYPNAIVKADIRSYNISRVHNGLELERIFPIKLEVAHGKRSGKVSKLGRYFHFGMHNLTTTLYKLGFSRFRFVQDTGVLNDSLFHLEEKNNYFLQGQWGNEKYFENVGEELHRHFIFKPPLDPKNDSWARQIKASNSVSVHIRRGDYIGDNSPFVELSRSDYYIKAFRHFAASIPDPVFFIFSDNPEWCRQNLTWLKDYNHHFISGNKNGESYKDMQLMSYCKHNIIANSTFSWWGAWLNRNTKKIVISPQHLFYDAEKNTKILREFYPESWVKL